MNCCKTRPAKKEYGRPGAGRGKDPDLEDAIAGLAGSNGVSTPFDPRVVNAACRSAVQGELSGDFGGSAAGRRAKNEIESKGHDGAKAPWWKVQLTENMTEAQLEAQERVLIGAVAKARSDEEKGRRTREVRPVHSWRSELKGEEVAGNTASSWPENLLGGIQPASPSYPRVRRRDLVGGDTS